MNNLVQAVQTLDSREVAKMVNKNHADLMRDIRGYVEYLGKSNIALADFFIESTYKDKQDKERPNYEVTKKGCELIAHKMTGEKGTQFSATYINRFHDMEDKLNKPSCLEDVLIAQLQEMKQLREQTVTALNTANKTKEEDYKFKKKD